MDLKEAILKEVEDKLSPERQNHTWSAQHICSHLARRFSLNEQEAWIASLWHDTAREWREEKLVEYVREHKLETTPLEKQVPMLLHSLVAAHRLQEELFYDNHRVWLAIRWHTTGHPDMGQLGYALYVADFLEPHRLHITGEQRDYILSLETLEQMMLEIYGRQFSHFAKNDISPEPASLRLYHKLKTMQG